MNAEEDVSIYEVWGCASAARHRACGLWCAHLALVLQKILPLYFPRNSDEETAAAAQLPPDTGMHAPSIAPMVT